MEKFHFWSCDLKKVTIRPFLLKKCLSWKWYALERNGRHFWITQGKKMYLTEKFHFWSCDFEQVSIVMFLNLRKLAFHTFCGKNAYLGNCKP